jgi:transcriptional regulator with XRE-family HTH domain
MLKIDSRKLEDARKLKNVTQKELSKALDMDQGGFSRKAKAEEFSEKEIEKIAFHLKVKVEDIANNGGVSINDLYKFLAKNAIKQESMLRVLLMTVGELLADKKGVPTGTLLDKLTEAVNSQSEHQIEKLQL